MLGLGGGPDPHMLLYMLPAASTAGTVHTGVSAEVSPGAIEDTSHATDGPGLGLLVPATDGCPPLYLCHLES